MKEKVDFIEAFKLFWKNYFNFTGRASRQEFWSILIWHITLIAPAIVLLYMLMFFVIMSIHASIPGAMAAIIGGVIIYGYIIIYSIATFIPNFSLLIRRYHDTGRTMLMPMLSLAIITPITIFIYIIAYIGIDLSDNTITVLTTIYYFFIVTFGIYHFVICCLRSKRKIQEK